MLESWTEFLTLEQEDQRCADEVETIKGTCTKDHGKRHFIECPQCWPRIINRMRNRYFNPATKEWFSGRRQFLQDLDSLFSQFHDHKVDLDKIELRIAKEKEEWFRERAKLLLPLATKTPAEARELQQKLDDKDMPTEQLSSELRNALSDGGLANEAALNDFLGQLRQAKSNQAKNEVYIDMFFQPKHDPEGAAKSQKYITMVRSGTPVADVIQTMLRDRQFNKGKEEEKQRLEKKLEELRRAKAAHEAVKAKKAKIRQEKADAAAAAEAENQYNLPPCLVCSKEVDIDCFTPCIFCAILHDVYGILDQTVVFCSFNDERHEEGYQSHSATHHCASGKQCRTLEDEDVNMSGNGNDNGEIVFCRECVESTKVSTMFCSPQCFDTNVHIHYEEVHNQESEEGKALEREEYVTLKDAEKAWEEKTEPIWR